MTKSRTVALWVALGSVGLVVACIDNTPIEPDSTIEADSTATASDSTAIEPDSTAIEPDSSAMACSSEPNVYDAADFTNVFEDFEQQTQMRLVGHQWDNTLVRNCRIHGTPGAAVFIRDANNVVIHNCEIWNTGNVDNSAIKMSAWGSGTENVTIDGNHIHDVPNNGIWSGEDVNVDHVGLKVINNLIERTGVGSSSGLDHPIYLQSSDIFIAGNTVSGPRDGNGISVRSSGVVRCNNVSGTSRSGKSGIKYYSDHPHGVSNLLVIEDNTVDSDFRGIQLARPVNSTRGSVPPTHVVKSFIIRNNVINAPTEIDIDSAYNNAPYSVTLENNST